MVVPSTRLLIICSPSSCDIGMPWHSQMSDGPNDDNLDCRSHGNIDTSTDLEENLEMMAKKWARVGGTRRHHVRAMTEGGALQSGKHEWNMPHELAHRGQEPMQRALHERATHIIVDD